MWNSSQWVSFPRRPRRFHFLRSEYACMTSISADPEMPNASPPVPDGPSTLCAGA